MPTTARRDCCIRGYHVYQDLWEAAIGEKLMCRRETSNVKDRYAVAVIKDNEIVGHLPQTLSLVCSLFLCRGGSVECEVTGTRRYSVDLPQGGLEIPCSLSMTGRSKEVKKLLRVIHDSS